jgi:hypothetical protein
MDPPVKLMQSNSEGELPLPSLTQTAEPGTPINPFTLASIR